MPAHHAALAGVLQQGGKLPGNVPLQPEQWQAALALLRDVQHAAKLAALQGLLQECGIGTGARMLCWVQAAFASHDDTPFFPLQRRATQRATVC